MLFNPGVLALVCGSILVWAITSAALLTGVGVVIGWDPDDGGERQLRKERRTLLVETTLRLIFWFELLSLFLFVAVADRIHFLLSGAMCAAGTFNSNQFGYPALWAKLATFVLCGLWIVFNSASGIAVTKGLVRFKLVFILAIWGALSIESLLQFRFFSGIDPDILTSCCATMFSDTGSGISSNIATPPVWASLATVLILFPATLAAGMAVRYRKSSPCLFSILSCLLGLAGGVAIVSWVAPAYYQLPNHHCPFCLLAPGVAWVGYPIFVALSVAVITGVAAGIVNWARCLDPFQYFKPGEERRLCAVSMACFTVFAAFAVWPLMYSGLRLEVI